VNPAPAIATSVERSPGSAARRGAAAPSSAHTGTPRAAAVWFLVITAITALLPSVASVAISFRRRGWPEYTPVAHDPPGTSYIRMKDST
jgi:hypothetical protein